MLPAYARVLDLAAGEGRNSVYLAQRGYAVEAVDISWVGLMRARQRAAMAGVHVAAVAADLTAFPIPHERYDLILDFFFLDRRLFPAMVAALRPGGLLIFETYTTHHQQLQRKRCMRREFLLEPSELRHAFPMLETLDYGEEGVIARLLARKPGKMRVAQEA